MWRLAFATLCLPSLALMAISCGGEKPPGDQSALADTTSAVPFLADSLLPKSTSSAQRMADPRIIAGAAAHEFGGPWAELYRRYQLVGLVSAKYQVGGSLVFAEIAQCANDIDAYGLYASIRPDGVDTYHLGTQGYLLGNSLYFTQDRYAVTLSTFDETESGRDAMRLLAVTISAKIGPAGDLPEQSRLFPDDKQILPSFKYYPSGFLGIPGLDRVFTASYTLGRDTLILFLTEDKGGTKFIRVLEHTAQLDKASSSSSEIPFDEDYGLIFSHWDYGTVLAGLKNLKLVGAAGCDVSRVEAFVSKWVGDL